MGEWILWGVVVVLLAVLSASLVVRNTTALPYYDPSDGENFFWTESAFHYHLAERASQGEPVAEKVHSLQHPEGIDVGRHHTVFMEWVLGKTHGWIFSEVPLHRFLLHAVAVMLSLGVVAAFFAAWIIWRSPRLGVFAAALYALAPAALARGTGQFLHEAFALPWLFAAGALFCLGFRRDSWGLGLLCGVFFLVGVAGWHLSEFYLLLFLLGWAGILLCGGGTEFPRRTGTAMLGVLLVGGLFIPVLSAKFFPVSTGMLVGYAMLLMIWLGNAEGSPWRRAGWIAGSLAGAAVVAVVIARWSETQTHVLAVIAAKLRHMGQLPADPTLLSPEARLLWTSSFVSARFEEILPLLGASVLFGGAGLCVLAVFWWRRRSLPMVWLFAAYLAVATFCGYLLFTRLSVFAVFFLAVVSAGFLKFAWQFSWRGGQSLWVIRVILVLVVTGSLVVEGMRHRDLRFYAARPPVSDLHELTEWLQENTYPEDAILTAFELGPTIAAYVGRPIPLHSKFESPEIRAKVMAFSRAILGSEEDLVTLLEDWESGYLVSQVSWMDYDTDSFLYRSGVTEVSGESALFRLHFAPERLERLALRWENPSYRVYQLLAEGETREAPPPAAHAVYRWQLFTDDPEPAVLTRTDLEDGWHRLFYLEDLYATAAVHHRERNLPELTRIYREILRVDPRNARIWQSLAAASLELGEFRVAGHAMAESVRLDSRLHPDPEESWPGEVLLVMGIASLELQDYATAEQMLRRVVRERRDLGLAQIKLALALYEQNQEDAAERSVREGLRIESENARGYEILGMILASQGDYPGAVEAVNRSLALQPEQPRLRYILSVLEERVATMDSEEDESEATMDNPDLESP